jgi:hypothetical protein
MSRTSEEVGLGAELVALLLAHEGQLHAGPLMQRFAVADAAEVVDCGSQRN